jgi:hypothetical protein
MGVSRLPRSRRDAAKAADQGWKALARELDAWARAGRTATFWWRDDDAVAPTPALKRLLRLAGRHRTPIALAVIPRPAVKSLFDRLADHANVRVLQHGYEHANHAPAGAKKCELGRDRPRQAVWAELKQGRAKLKKQAPARLLLDVMVPPWNRIDPGVAAGLHALGFKGLSTDKPRRALHDPAGLVRANTHIETIDWTNRRFIGEKSALRQTVRHLSARRRGQADGGEPTGLLTHHLAHDEAGWRFIDRFLGFTAGHPGASWLDAARVFRPQGRPLGHTGAAKPQ